MIDPELIIARVKSLSLFAVVGGAAEAAALMKSASARGDGPNAYVVPMADDAQPPKAAGGPQPSLTTVGVMIMVRRHGDASGEMAMNRLYPLRQALRTGMAGWPPADGFQPMFWRGGRLLDFDTASLWWLEEFSSRSAFFPNP